MRKIKGFISVVLVLAMAISLCTTSFAAENNNGKEAEYQLTIDGIVYTVVESYNENEKVVKVTDGDSETKVTLNDDGLSVQTDYGTTMLSAEELENEYSQSVARTSVSKTSLFWDYYYYYSDSNFNKYGMYFSFRCGDEGSWSGFDRKNKEARDIGYDYCSAVRALDTAQFAASAASGVSGGAIAAAIASAAPTGGIGAVVGVVVAIIGAGVAVAEWVGAWNASLDCNQLFLQFKQAL